jgi:Tol biopolymer transport system component
VSPDGSKIVFRFERGDDSTSEIYVMAAGGSYVRNLSRSPGMDNSPSWSPDGRRIVFGSARGALVPSIWVMDADGRHARRVSRLSGEYPGWSRGGRRIAFAVNLGGSSASFELYVMNADGSRLGG